MLIIRWVCIPPTILLMKGTKFWEDTKKIEKKYKYLTKISNCQVFEQKIYVNFIIPKITSKGSQNWQYIEQYDLQTRFSIRYIRRKQIQSSRRPTTSHHTWTIYSAFDICSYYISNAFEDNYRQTFWETSLNLIVLEFSCSYHIFLEAWAITMQSLKVLASQ